MRWLHLLRVLSDALLQALGAARVAKQKIFQSLNPVGGFWSGWELGGRFFWSGQTEKLPSWEFESGSRTEKLPSQKSRLGVAAERERSGIG